MNITNIAANNAYSMAGKLASSATESSGSTGGFSDMVFSAAKSAVNTIKSGEQTSLNAVAGKASLSEVVTAVNSADIALKSMVAIRDKVINAYQDILKMPI